MFLKRISGVLLVAASMVATAAADDPSSEKKPEPPQERPDDLICTYERPVGTNIPRRVCATRAQRDQQQRDSQDAARRMRSPGNSAGSVGGN